MSGVTDQSWFWPAVGVVIGLPIGLLLLNELQGVLRRRDSSFVKVVALARNWLLPAAAVYLLLGELSRHEGMRQHSTWAKVAATVLGFVIMLVLLSGANAALFGKAAQGTWRSRMPGIFIDLGRLILIIIGIALLLSWVWGANIGGLITAVGVTSIVIGLAVQNAVGPVISGLLLLFEQPFRIGDWLDTKVGEGRVKEVNWRAVHLDTGNGIQVVPNAALAGDAFINRSRTTLPYYKAKAIFAFAVGDPPGEVTRALLGVADGLPGRLLDAKPSVFPLGTHDLYPDLLKYQVTVPVASPSAADSVVGLLRRRVWYAAQRAGLHLDNAVLLTERDREFVPERLKRIAAGIGIDADAAAGLERSAKIVPYAEGEIVQQANTIPPALGFIVEGTVSMFAAALDGELFYMSDLSVGDYVGGASLARQRMNICVMAKTDVTVIAVSPDAMNAIVSEDPLLARRIGEAVEMRRRVARDLIAEQTALRAHRESIEPASAGPAAASAAAPAAT